MRGLIKTAAWLLIPALASAFPPTVVPDEVLPGRVQEAAGLGAEHIIEHRPQDAVVAFSLPCLKCSIEERDIVEQANFTLQVLQNAHATPHQPGLLLNGFDLHGVSPQGPIGPMYGITSFEIQRPKDESSDVFQAEWRMSYLCLKPKKHVPCPVESMAKVLTFSMRQFGQYPHPGFTITYKHLSSPEIIRLSPFVDADAEDGKLLSKHWQSPSSLLPLSSPRLRASDEVLGKSIPSVPIPSIPTSSEPYSPTSWIVVDLPTSTPATPDTTLSSSHPTATRSEAILESSQILDVSFEQPSPTPLTTSFSPLRVQGGFHTLGRSFLKEAYLIPTEPTCLERAQLMVKNLVYKTKGKLRGTHSYAASSQSSMHETAESSTPSESVSLESLSSSNSELDYSVSKPSILPLVSSDRLLEDSSSSPASQDSDLHNPRAMCVLKFAPLVFILLCLTGGILKHMISSPRRRADWAAQREECRNRRLYARAARCQKFRNWFQRLRGGSVQHKIKEIGTSWQEKLGFSNQPPDISPVDIESEIRAMRQAYGVVNNILRAEEGRGREGIQIVRYPGWQGWRTRASRSDSDVTGPPPYEEDGPFAEWFRYSQTGVDDTPDSSVIDTSSRDSDCEKD